MDYKLTNTIQKDEHYTKRLFKSGKELRSYLNKKSFSIAILLALISSGTAIITPYYLGTAIDTYVTTGDLQGLLKLIFLLGIIYAVGAVTTYFQQRVMGKASQEALYKLRATIFEKIQSLPIAFFNQNKTGDLMSRINNDTDKLSQFLSETLLRSVGSIFTLVGISIFILILNLKLGLVLLSSTVFLLIFTRVISPHLEYVNKQSSGSLGNFTAGVSEQLTNFKAIIAFDRRNFFESFLSGLNKETYKKSILADFLNQIFSPIYDFAGYIAQVVVLAYGLFLISQGEISIGLLVGFLTYALRFYDPLRWVANLFGSIQISLASWGRVRDILSLTSNLQVLEGVAPHLEDTPQAVMVFDKVSFDYEDNQQVIHDVSFVLEEGKTYALVGPTGGGKTTIASLMSRLYDPTHGTIFWKHKDMRTYRRDQLSRDIGVILQEPYLFSGTVAYNICYGNKKIAELNEKELETLLVEKGMGELLKRLPEGLQTKVETGGENISIGQKQLISFVRTILREPSFLILDEATANIDTVTESTLQKLIDSLPPQTTKVIIAHRLNTIKNADEILFVGGKEVKRVSDEQEVMRLLRGISKS